jgi:methionyl-tRNA formyltransferase
LTRRIGVAATAPFGADVLERLAASYDVAFLLTRPDAPSGRGRKVAPPPAKSVAERLEIPVLQPERLSSGAGGHLCTHVPPDVDAVVVAAYGLLIPDALLERTLWLNVHPSLLPRWRGAAPVERAIMAGDRETGVTIHRTVKALDAGPVAAQGAFVIEEDDDAGAVFARAAELAVDLLGGVLEEDEPRFEPQPEEGVTYADKITAADRTLDLADPEQAARTVRALSPHIGARATIDGRDVIVWRARVDDGRFVPVEVQPPGKRRMSYDEFRRGLR